MATSREGQSSYLPHSETFLRSLLWQDARMDIIFDVLAHPSGMPSIPELVYMEEFRDEDEVLHQLSMLVEYGILQRVSLDADETDDDLPTTFYALTPEGRDCIAYFDESFGEGVRRRLTQEFERENHPEHIEKYLAAPRPALFDAEGGNV